MTRAIHTIKDLSADYLMNRFGNRAIKKSLPINEKNYTAILVTPNNIAKKSPNTSPDVYLFDGDKFVSRTATRNCDGAETELITEATAKGYKNTIKYGEAYEIEKEINDIELTNLGLFREKSLIGKIIDRLKGLNIDNKTPVRIKTTTYIGTDGKPESKFFRIIGNGENSSFSIDSSNNKLSLNAYTIDKKNKSTDFEFVSEKAEDINNHKNYLEMALNALKTFN